MGRKSTFTQKAADEIVARLSKGEPLTVICQSPGMPCDDTVRIWAEKDAAFARDIARAREVGFDQIALDALTISDDRNDDPASRRVRVETRLKLLAKWDPKRYGDKLQLGGDGSGVPITIVSGVPRADG